MMSDEEEFALKLKEFVSFRTALTKESDRGCGLFAAAYLDKAISDLLAICFVPDRKINGDLFEGGAPLATFSARIKMAFYLGKISKEARADLDTIRSIRNEFAHNAEILTFDDQSIADKCRNLRFSYHERAHRPRGHYTAAVTGILTMLRDVGMKSAAPPVKPNEGPTDEMKKSLREHTDRLFEEIISKQKPAHEDK